MIKQRTSDPVGSGIRRMNKARGKLPWLGILVSLGYAGCGLSSTPVAPVEPPFSGVTIAVAAVGDAKLLPTLAAQRADWEQRRGGRVEIRSEAVEPGRARE